MAATMTVPKRAKLWNKGDRDFKHMVIGKEVFIPKGGYIDCSRSEAMKIRGHCTGKDEPVTLIIELVDDGKPEREKFIDHRTGQEFPTRNALLKHLGIDPKEVDAEQNATVYSCPGCDQTFKDAESAKVHMAACLLKFAKPEEKKKTK